MTLTLADRLKDTGQALDDIGGRLAAVNSLPQGAGPINFQRDFGDAATLLLTVASPKADEREIDLRREAIRQAINAVRPNGASKRVSLILCLPLKVDKRLILLAVPRFEEELSKAGSGKDARVLDGRVLWASILKVSRTIGPSSRCWRLFARGITAKAQFTRMPGRPLLSATRQRFRPG